MDHFFIQSELTRSAQYTLFNLISTEHFLLYNVRRLASWEARQARLQEAWASVISYQRMRTTTEKNLLQ